MIFDKHQLFPNIYKELQADAFGSQQNEVINAYSSTVNMKYTLNHKFNMIYSIYFELILAVCIGTAVAQTSEFTQLETEEFRINVDEISSSLQGSPKNAKNISFYISF